jgi:ubiquitin-conjugating enzyme E2 D/E
MDLRTKLVMNSLRTIDQDPAVNVFLDPFPDTDLFHWHGIIMGPLDTPYENGIFHFDIIFPDKFPFMPPEFRLRTRIFHPNISPNGSVCMDILNDNWSAAYSVDKILLSFVSLLYNPTPDDPFNPEAAQHYHFDRERYNQIAREWTQNYATDSSMEQTITVANEAITQQLNGLETNHLSNVSIHPANMRDLFFWQGTIIGPSESPYHDISFTINIRFPLNYPEKPPSVVFRSKIYHPNIGLDGFTGKQDSTRRWTSNIAVSSILQDLVTLLSNPIFDDLNDGMALLYQNDRQAYNQMARKRTLEQHRSY